MIDLKDIVNKFEKENLPIILAGKWQEDRKIITVRFIANIKEVDSENVIVFHKFKPFFPNYIFKREKNIKAIFSLPNNSYETILNVKEIDVNALYTNFPSQVYISRPIRIEPSPKKPILLYILNMGEATSSCDVINISEQGVCFISERDYAVNGMYGFTIVLPDQLGIITCFGEIRYKVNEKIGLYRYGVKLFIHPKDRAVIAKYIMMREKEIVEMLRGY